jgi:hypothetical protein
VLPGSAFGEPADSLTIRVCTGQLTGEIGAQREQALTTAAPTGLFLIADALAQLDRALSILDS